MCGVSNCTMLNVSIFVSLFAEKFAIVTDEVFRFAVESKFFSTYRLTDGRTAQCEFPRLNVRPGSCRYLFEPEPFPNPLRSFAKRTLEWIRFSLHTIMYRCHKIIFKPDVRQYIAHTMSFRSRKVFSRHICHYKATST